MGWGGRCDERLMMCGYTGAMWRMDGEDGWGGIVWLDGHSGCCRARILGHIEAVRCRLIVAFYQGRDGISVVTSGEVYPSGQETSSGPREPRSITHTGVF